MAIPQPKRREDDFGGGFHPRPLRLWPVTYWLIAINIAMFLAQLASQGIVTNWGDFSIAGVIYGFQLWRFLTFQFLHASLWHLLFNMVTLYYFGDFVERRLGARRFLAFYLICGACGGASYLLIWQLGFIRPETAGPMVGASAGIFGVLIAVLYLAPRMIVQLLFPPIALRMRTLAAIFLVIAVGTIFLQGSNAGGEAAHLGGALVGWILIKNVHWLNIFDHSRKRAHRFWRPGDPASTFFREDIR